MKGSGEGADNVKIVKMESGTRLPASYRSGRFDEWKAKNHTHVPRVGEAELEGATRRSGSGHGGKRFKHTSSTPAKPLNKLNKDYERKSRQIRKREQDRGDTSNSMQPASGKDKGKNGKPKGRYGGKPIGRVRSELKSAEQIRKSRELVERKRAKNARAPKRFKRK